MIENLHLVHGQIDSSLQAWQPESFFITGLLLAVLATILSFQSTSLTYDLFLGIKPRGEVKAPNLHMLLLADEGSPLSVAAAVFRRDEFDRARFYGDIPRTTTIVRNRAQVTRSIAVKLFFMLLAAPLINLIAVFLALEYNEDVSFSEAGFGAVGYGFNRDKNLTLKFDEFGAKCFRFRTSFSHAADEHAQFFYCLDTFVEVDLDEPAQATELILTALPTGQLQATLQRNKFSTAPMFNSHVDVFTGEEVYRIAQAFTQDDLQDLANEMAIFMKETCPFTEPITPTSERVARNSRVEEKRLRSQLSSKVAGPEPAAASEPRVQNIVRQNVLTASQTVDCPILVTEPPPGIADAVLGFAFENANLTTLVDTDTFRVVNIRDLPVNGGEPSWFDGSDLTLLKRRRNFVPVGILFLVVGVLVMIRFLAECITNNDVYDGIDEVVARNIGLSNSYSMIRSDRLLRYDHKYQSGLAAHYGTPRPGIPEVEQFRGGAVGLGGPEDPSQGQADLDAAKFYGEEIMNPTHIDL